MTNTSPRNIDSEHAEFPQSLIDRVAERVVNARLAIEANAKATGASSRRARSAPDSSLFEPKNAAELREIQSLKRVFRDLGNSYRRYRRQTGGPVVPGLREAAYNFRANPSLPALVAVAAFLDDLDLLS
jgi:hypothetical protein